MTPPFTPRPSQQNILRYNGGRLGIAAVPGAGKTQILSALAARIIDDQRLQDGQEVLIVTLVNSAVDNFEARIKTFFADRPLRALYKYRVRTLHGLAHDIVREKPGSVGLDNKFGIIDEREAESIRKDAVRAWLAENERALIANYFKDDLQEYEINRAKNDQRFGLADSVEKLAYAFIRTCKDRSLTPEDVRRKLDSAPAPLFLAEAGCWIYGQYQQSLRYRGAVDFDDLITYAHKILESDPEYLARLQYRFPFVLEDEAQDSSLTQQKILQLLSGGVVSIRPDEHGTTRPPQGNWVRVGDPNQAIFETFTTADPELLREFIRNNEHADMPESGRSQPSILALANHLIDWVMTAHPDANVRSALSLPHIVPAPAGDPQQNPLEDREGIKLISKKYTPEEELDAVVKSIKSYVDSFAETPIEEQPTIAVLVPRNARGVDVVSELRKRGIEPIELISSTAETRAAAGALNLLLSYLADPQSAGKLANAYRVYRRDVFGSNRTVGAEHRSAQNDEATEDAKEDAAVLRPYIERIPALLRKMVDVENFVAPKDLTPGPSPKGRGESLDWLAALGESEAEQVVGELSEFRERVQRWLKAVTLPIDQLVLTLAQDVFSEASDLALAHKLALVLRGAANDHTDWRLPELTSELAVIAKNERRFIGFSSDDSGFDPERHRGRVVVTTMHKAKGLEWDRVYMMSVNNYDFPSNAMGDRFISEKWFIRDGLNLEAEALAQLTAITGSRYGGGGRVAFDAYRDPAAYSTTSTTRPANDEYDWYEEGTATMQSRLGYAKERLRLLYVGITRAKKGLIVTWNSGRQGDATPSLALSELMGWWEAGKG